MRIGRASVLLLLLLLAFSISFAEEEGDSITSLVQEQQSSSGLFEIVKNWKAITLVILVLTILLIALARSTGHGFDLPDLKAWANIELVQLVGTALIIIILLGTLTFLDTIFPLILEGAGTGITCTSDSITGCTSAIAEQYNNELIDLANEDITDILKKSYEEGKIASLRTGLSTHQFITGQLSISFVPHAQRILNIERYSQIIENYTGVLSSLYAQRFFLQSICFKIAPAILLIGLVTRSFFGTRKLGGLLIAIAIGLMVVFPLMYVFDWVVLTVTLYGDSVFGMGDALLCPEVCMQELPLGYYANDRTHVVYASDIEELFLDGQLNPGIPDFDYALSFFESQKALVLLNKDVIISCGVRSAAVSDLNDYCPEKCRYTPYPYNAEGCGAIENLTACLGIPADCKGDLVMDEETLPDYLLEQMHLCSYECKTIPPLNGDCGGIFSIDVEWIHEPDQEQICEDLGGKWTGDQCEIDGYFIEIGCSSSTLSQPGPQTEKVESLCRAKLENDLHFDSDYVGIVVVDSSFECAASTGEYELKEHLTGTCEIYEGCSMQDRYCALKYYTINAQGERVLTNTVHENCFVEMDKEFEEMCPASLDPYENCVYIIPEDTGKCSGCLFSDTAFTFDPAVATDCATLCEPNKDTFTTVSTGEFAQKASNGLYGTFHTRNVASFFLPAYILPLLNILVTVMFIQTFSPMLGGDIEIPGLSKVL